MNWTPEAVHAEMAYRTELAMGGHRTTQEHLRGARARRRAGRLWRRRPARPDHAA